MRSQTVKEENLNAATHGLAFLFSLIGFVFLFLFQKESNFETILGICLYGSSLLILYFVSTLYHFEKNVERKAIYRKLDHISIYLLIAGTYSPVVLIVLQQSLGWILFWIVWTIAISGTFLKLFFTGKYEILSVLLYLIMGWLIVFDITALSNATGETAMWFLYGGGVAYTAGIVFYALDSVKYSHAIWHIMVMLGSILHYIFIFSIIR